MYLESLKPSPFARILSRGYRQDGLYYVVNLTGRYSRRKYEKRLEVSDDFAFELKFRTGRNYIF